jgi:peptidoglycan hydrolase-like protein with peptidoglycan-binding domain
MKKLTSVFAVAVGGALIATSAFAQGAPSTTTPPMGTQQDPSKKDSERVPDKGPVTGPATDRTKADTGAVKSDRKADMKGGRADRMVGGNREHVKAVQQALKDKGHDPGDVDGRMGPRTRQALKDFQQKEGMQATGQLDSGTMDKLGVQARADRSTSASPSTGAGSVGAGSSGTASGPMGTPPRSDREAATGGSVDPAGKTKQPQTR